jgi:hypothetical protein
MNAEMVMKQQNAWFGFALVLGLAACSGDGVSGQKDNLERSDDYAPCAEKACGDVCQVCDPDDADCVETAELKTCDAEGQCVPASEAATCGAPNDDHQPCADKSCGDTCQVCAPTDPECVEDAALKACNADGQCVPHADDLCEGPGGYEPCAGKAPGDQCTVCDPADAECVETDEVKVCSDSGQCSALTENPGEYDPCADKAPGDLCTVCDPTDADCAETAELKVCDEDGQCRPSAE